MKKLIDISRRLQYVIVVLALMIIIGFTNSKQKARYVNNVAVVVDNQFENYFIDQQDVLNLINDQGVDYLLNLDKDVLDLKDLEIIIENHQFVEDAQAYIDLHGNLSIDVKQNRPIARVFNRSGEDYYISSQGEVLPESEHYTARVILIELEDEDWMSEYSMLDSKSGEEVFALLNFINDHPFWHPQIAGMKIKKNMDIELYPQVTKQTIMFGKADKIEDKFSRLMTFYKKVLPYKGWNTYNTVNLKFNDQIVCK
ncbi:MAG: cell division protein FtsQ [Reichenbachiella sp.]